MPCIHSIRGASCSGCITAEHFVSRGKRGIFKDCVIPACVKHNVGVYGLDKRFNELLGIKIYRDKLKEICPKRNWEQMEKYLSEEFKEYDQEIDKYIETYFKKK